MTKANDMQIGGKHYKLSYEHWDFVVDTNTPYLLACVSKYISRYHDKNGIEDVKKSLHYLDKAIETNCQVSTHHSAHLGAFASQFDKVQEEIISAIYDRDGFVYVRSLIVDLIDDLEYGATSAYVRG